MHSYVRVLTFGVVWQEECQTIRALALAVLRASQSPLVRKIGVSCLAPCLKRHGNLIREPIQLY